MKYMHVMIMVVTCVPKSLKIGLVAQQIDSTSKSDLILSNFSHLQF